MKINNKKTKTKKLLSGILTACVMSASFLSALPVSAQTIESASIQTVQTKLEQKDIIQTAERPTAESPTNELLISNEDDFVKFMNTSNYWSNNAKVKLTCNIDMKGATFKPIKKFSGEFDGCGYTISNFNIQDNPIKGKKFELAFIKTLNRTAKFQNVTFDNYSVKDTGSSAIRPRSYKAAGFAINNNGYIMGVNLKNSRMVNVNKTSKRGKTAGFVVNNEQGKIVLLNNVNTYGLLIEYGLIENCFIDMTSKNSNISAGFVYKNNWIINNCSSNCNAKCTKDKNAYLGGFCSKNLIFGNISNCKSSGSVKATKAISTNRCGGFVGVNYSNITYCSSTGSAKSVGTILSNSKDKYSKKDVTSYVGGFCGRNLGNISSCDAKGSAIASAAIKKAKVGGFVGENSKKGEITSCTAIGDSKASSYSRLASVKTGGFVGTNKAKILNSKSSGYVYLSVRHSRVRRHVSCGGFVGENSEKGNIDNCYAECTVETPNHKKGGGFVGKTKNKSIIKNSQCKSVCVTGYDASGSATLVKAKFCYHRGKKSIIDNCKSN